MVLCVSITICNLLKPYKTKQHYTEQGESVWLGVKLNRIICFLWFIYFLRLKAEIERLVVEFNENICKEEQKYNLDTNKLKDQIFEHEVIQKTLEKEVCYFYQLTEISVY